MAQETDRRSTDRSTDLDLDWAGQVLEQLSWHWEGQVRPRLDGLTDAEYTWEPVPGAWSLRPRAEATTALAAGGGDLVLDFAYPEPTPAPVTTIAWRLGHLIVGVFGARVASHFGGSPMDYGSFEYAPTAAGALAQLDELHAAWVAGLRGLDAEGWARPVGPAEGPWADAPMVGLALHINREAIHHLAEICLLRDLYASAPDGQVAR